MDKKLRNIISEELSKIIKEDYDYAAEERAHHDQEYYTQDVEAEISSALSFMQDAQGSLNNLKAQTELVTTSPEVDGHLEEAINHIRQAIESYVKLLSPEIKSRMADRIGEVNIEK